MNIYDDLVARGLLRQVTKESLKQRLNNKISVYCGFDPTADSLHVGSLLPLVTLLRFARSGHDVWPLVGGATGMIGDPSGKSAERVLNDTKTVEEFKQKIASQIESFIGKPPVDNYDFFANMDVFSFLRWGKFFTVNYMLGKESVRSRIEREDQGISYTEFSYMVLQAMDFHAMYDLFDCELQIGGSDQWGNITAGIDLIHKVKGNDKEAWGLTIPLVTNSEGKKFGKTEAGAIWLDKHKTSVYDFYQFWLNTSDADVYKFLKYFSFRSVEEIDLIEQTDKERGGKPLAQSILAQEMTALVHGQQELDSVIRVSKALFEDGFDFLTLDDFAKMKQMGVTFKTVNANATMQDVLIETGLASSKREAKEFLANSAVSVNKEKVLHPDIRLTDFDKYVHTYWVVRRGKKNYAIVSV